MELAGAERQLLFESLKRFFGERERRKLNGSKLFKTGKSKERDRLISARTRVCLHHGRLPLSRLFLVVRCCSRKVWTKERGDQSAEGPERVASRSREQDPEQVLER